MHCNGARKTWVHARLPALDSSPAALGKSCTPPRLKILSNTTGILTLGPLGGCYGEVLG